jgi:beta-lactamase superfamily II metal-dependent hydrolase
MFPNQFFGRSLKVLGIVGKFVAMRYRLLLVIITSFFLISFEIVHSQIPARGETLSPWKEGLLDLHHINTGRGNASYYIFPDGTTLLFDAGEQDPTDPRTTSRRNAVIRPNDSKRPYEWIVHYIKQVAPGGRNPVINYAVLSHFHNDHMGGWYEMAPHSQKGNYRLSGITGVAEFIPIETLVDRGYPTYNFPHDFRSKALEDSMKKNPVTYKYWKGMENYFSFLRQREHDKLVTTTLQVGSKSQLAMLYNRSGYPEFHVRNVKCNGQIWTGIGEASTEHFTTYRASDSRTYPTENACSQVITINYGNFKYYTGGDIPGNVQYGQQSWMDVESPVAKAIGAVDVATMDHHGNRDALNETFVKTLQPRVWVEEVWSADHPGHEVLIRATTPHLYPGPRDIFATNMLQANRDVMGAIVDRSYKSTQGHILVRVLPGGSSYYVIILDDSVQSLVVKDVFGPYEVKKK